MERGEGTLEQETKTYSRNAHHMVVSYNNKVYHVDSVNVNQCDDKEAYDAVFHAKEVPVNKSCELNFKIPHLLCDVLIEYAKLDNPDAILILNIENNRFTWNVLSEAWLKQTSNIQNVKHYVA